ncbi:MAG: DUF3467 domain-containing protein [Actinomycetota bacterium]
MTEPPQQQTEFEIQVPPDMEAGAYANFLMVWHTGHEFTLDFAVTQPSQPGETGVKVPCRVVSRLRVPPPVMVEILQAMTDNVARYQQTFGEIHRPSGASPSANVDRTEDRPGAGGYH